MRRYYLGIDLGDRRHAVAVGDERGRKVAEVKLEESVEGMAEFGRWVDERRGEGIELWAAIEKPEGRIVDFLLDHGVGVFAINPKALDRARDRFRQSGSKSDPFDAWVLCEFLRTDHMHLKPLAPNSEQAQELKILTRDHQRLVRQRSRLLNQLEATLKEYYVRPVEVFGALDTQVALDFLKQCPTPQVLSGLSLKGWKRFARAHHLSEKRSAELWGRLSQAQLSIPDHVVRAKAQLTEVLVEELEVLVKAVEKYGEKVERFFAFMPAAKLTKKLPGGRSGTMIPTVWAQLGDAEGRWESFRHLQAHAGTVPVTKRSGKSQVVHFRYACNKEMRHAVYLLAFISLRQSEWAAVYYRRQRERGSQSSPGIAGLGSEVGEDSLRGLERSGSL